MMSVDTIRAMSRDAARKAAKDRKEPFIVEAEDIADWKVSLRGFPFPFIGTYVPKGWKLVDTYFVDSSGMGSDNEPALSVRQFIDKLEPGYGYAVTEAGQFQVYVGKYQRRRAA
jgi:hypothetical protein